MESFTVRANLPCAVDEELVSETMENLCVFVILASVEMTALSSFVLEIQLAITGVYGIIIH